MWPTQERLARPLSRFVKRRQNVDSSLFRIFCSVFLKQLIDEETMLTSIVQVVHVLTNSLQSLRTGVMINSDIWRVISCVHLSYTIIGIYSANPRIFLLRILVHRFTVCSPLAISTVLSILIMLATNTSSHALQRILRQNTISSARALARCTVTPTQSHSRRHCMPIAVAMVTIDHILQPQQLCCCQYHCFTLWPLYGTISIR